MPTVTVTIEPTDTLPTALTERLTRVDEDDAELTRRELVRVLLVAGEDTVDVETPIIHPDWERGDPCPGCGEHNLSVMAADEDLYQSRNGEFTYCQNETVIGVQTLIFCPTCETYLRDSPQAGI
jgi:hypothetical protein